MTHAAAEMAPEQLRWPLSKDRPDLPSVICVGAFGVMRQLAGKFCDDCHSTLGVPIPKAAWGLIPVVAHAAPLSAAALRAAGAGVPGGGARNTSHSGTDGTAAPGQARVLQLAHNEWPLLLLLAVNASGQQ